MLVSLLIENFALVDRLELELASGLNVLTGETGAGKSIILDAVDLVLGGKATQRMLRTGSTRSLIEATFRLTPLLQKWLSQNDLDPLEGDSLICSRELSATKSSLRSRSRINGILVNRQQLAELREQLVEVTAQGQTGQLLKSEWQRELLDAFGGSAITTLRDTVRQTFEAAQRAKQALEERRQSEQTRLQRQDLLEFQLNELNAAELEAPTELTELLQERDRLGHVVDLQQLSYDIHQLLYQSDDETPAAADLLAKAEDKLTAMVGFDQSLESWLSELQEAVTQTIEVGRAIERYGESLEADPDRLETVEDRIRQLKQICRKYGPELEDAIALRDSLQQEFEQLTADESSLEVLTEQYQAQQALLIEACAALTQARGQAAQQLATNLIDSLKPLAMDKVQFECRLEPMTPSSKGADRVVFYFSPNPGEAIQPLAETASGGEMSRFLLALKTCFADAKLGAGTLIFDEIDAGVSGKVAQAIADKLKQLSQQRQVLCVTHQPLIAALADAHYQVAKQVIEVDENGQTDPTARTVVRVTSLDVDRRREELAQLTGGHSAEQAIAFAESLLAQAGQKTKKTTKRRRSVKK